ncbi:papilin [Battus philenor]|uniref:papilin n=1 Tax=Battus philenor TaxID=42288 RepID=UPI0035CFBB9E
MAPISLRSLLLAAIVLSNYLVWTATRHHHVHNLSRHRSRHRRQGAGLYLPASFVLPEGEGTGAWGEWGEVSPCSRTCGGGVASQKRICLEISPDGQPLCTGGDTKYFSCQTQDCPADSGDFRAQQCSDYDDVAFRGIKYKWLPYTNAPNPCELNCMPRGERFYFRQKAKVVDGTRCNDESFDVCVNGTCQPVGCDMMLGSNAREDKCRECRGNGTNCHTASGIIDTTDLRKGYNDVLLIPQGATSIYIAEVRSSNNYLALRAKQDNVYYLNGEYHIDFPRSLMIAGALWHYERSQQGFAAPDKLRCLGPTTEPLYLSLLLQDENVGIEYEYSVPSELAPPPNQQYNWVHEEFTPCSASCGGGVQTRQVTCRSREDLEVVEDGLCDEGLKPVTSQSCGTDPCPARWVVEPWSPCSKPCGEGGTRSRQVYCQKLIVNGFPSIVADKECFELLGPKPELYQECNRNATCPTWFTGPWKPCDQLCGEGKQTRQVVCHQKTNGKVELFDDSMCEEEKPATEQSCMMHPCDGVDWVLSEWSGCDTCTSTVRTRVAHCATKDHKVVNSSFCSYHPAPVLEEPCDSAKLPTCELQWYATQWSKCSVECGKGVQTRQVFCGLFDGTSVTKVDDMKCESKKKYNDTKPCEISIETCAAKWYAGPWSECTKDCGGGEQYRRVMCLSGGVEVNVCSEETMLETMQSCNTEPCAKSATRTTASSTDEDYDYEECIEEEDYPEVGAEELIPVMGSTVDDMMLSDSPYTDEGSGSNIFSEFESHFTLEHETGSGLTGTDFWTTSETGSGSFTTDFDDDGTVFTYITTESTSTDAMSELTKEFIPFKTTKVLLTESGKAGVTETEFSEVTTDGSADSSGTSNMSESDRDETSGTLSTESSVTTNLPDTDTTLLGFSLTTDSPEKETTTSGASISTKSSDSEITTESSTSTYLSDTETTSLGSSETTDSPDEGTITSGSSLATDSSEKETTADSSASTDLPFSSSVTTDSSTDLTETETTLFKSSVTTEPSTDITETTLFESSAPTSDSSSTMEISEKITTESGVSTELPETGTTSSELSEMTDTTETDITSESSITTTSASETETTLSELSSTTETSEKELITSESSSTIETSEKATTEESSVTTGLPETSSKFGETTEISEKETSSSGLSLITESSEKVTAAESSETTDLSKSSVTTEAPEKEITTSDLSSTTESSEKATTTESRLTTDLAEKATTSSDISVTTESLEKETSTSGSSLTTESLEKETTTSESRETTDTSEKETTETITTSTEGTGSTEVSATEKSTELETSESSSTPSSEVSTTELSESTSLSTEAELASTTEGSVISTVSGPSTELNEESTTSGYSSEASGTSPVSTESASTTDSSITEQTTNGIVFAKIDGLFSAEISTEKESGTVGTTSWDWKTTVEEFTAKPRCKARRKVAKCLKSKFGCCPDKKTPAAGPFEEGCPNPKTCKETKYGCCPDGVSPATGFRNKGCPTLPCNETLYGCCLSDNVTAAEDNNQQGCPPPPEPCISSEFGCCPDMKTEAKGLGQEGCFEPTTVPEAKTTVSLGCFASEFGCCFDNVTEANGPNEKGCPCAVTEFGCCPDGISAAKGTQMEGCVFSCNATQHGCCADGETPAHGPNQEGCCLLYPFGCCPDNRKPAEGPHLEGCGCVYAQYGCCPDNFTIARGTNNEGCGCQYTEFGCCPDRHTEAKGPDNEGCTCNTYQFGCCPDGVTVATGPNFQGCLCQHSQYGCCSDDLTEAVGPDQLGCDCASSKYGCCLDGKTEAKGEKFLGCSDAPENKQEACSLPTERGPCRNYTVYWFYDMDYGGCSRFWYGGCEGNGNRFASKEECEGVCVQPAPKEACNLPKVKGACVGYHLRWYFDAEQQVCGQFVYGGCLGNANNFDSRELCQTQCEPVKTENECSLPIEEGPCSGSYARWAYNAETRRCYEFVWGGCAGNANRFRTEAACMQRCNPPGAQQPECAAPQETGNCTDKQAAWSYSEPENRCVPFYYSGCGGNGNRFESEQSCVAACPSTYEKDLCILPAETGDCADYAEKWFFDTSINRCRLFYYGGCGGNGNRFDTQQQCEARCSDAPVSTTVLPTQPTQPAQITQTAQTAPPSSQRPDFCSMALDPGPCEQLESRWGYDASLGTCTAFMYGGCGGNRNNFPTQEYCNYYCPDEQLESRFGPEASTANICQFPMRAGPCDESLMRWFYDPASDSCSQFTYGGCEGNENRFESLEACERRCKTGAVADTTTTLVFTTQSTTPTTTIAAMIETIPQNCQVSPILEECTGASTVWFLDSSRQCVSHQNQETGAECRYTGVFQSQEACERSCGAFRNIDVCRYPVDPGPCRSFESKFYFDAAYSRCQEFLYGGCHGGPNRFSTFEECEQVCRPETDPCKQRPEPGNCLAYLPMWYYDEERDDCNQFVYGGCNGNDNRFDTKEDCEGRCKKRPLPPTTTVAPATIAPTTPSTTTTTTTSPTTVATITTEAVLQEPACRPPASLAPCGANATVYYYEASRGACLRAEIGNCRYENSYRSEEECERRCGAFKGLDVCGSRLDPGPCLETGIMKVYWDADTGRCQPFAYGGCLGGPNRFSSVAECEETCGSTGPDASCLQPVSMGSYACGQPARRWHYSTTYGDCLSFIYFGCEGNLNNFVSYEECADVCKITPTADTNEVLPECEAFDAECASLRCAYGVQRTRTATGCERCACVQVEVDCAPLRQECERLKCYYGMQRNTGDDGCERCRCLDHPCASKSCAEGERCVPSVFRDPVLQEISYVASCNIVNKTGLCPPVEELAPLDGSCRRECNDDADCRGEAKCCARGCSQLCTAPAATASSPAPRTTSFYMSELPQAPQANTDTEPEVSGAEGGKATLRCLFYGMPPPKITWRHGEITIDSAMDRYRLLSDGALEIVSLYRNDSGVYVCVADNGLGIATQEIHLVVNDPVEAPVGIAGEENAVVTGELYHVLNIRCMAYGYPMPIIQWFRGLSGPMVPFSSSVYEARGSVLQIRRLDYDTLGDYACQAYNGIGKPASWSVVVQAYRPDGDDSDNPYLVERHEPALILPQTPPTEATTTPAPQVTVPVYTVPVSTRILAAPATVASGAELRLPCEVDGYPEPDVYWTKDGVPLASNDRVQITETRLTILSTNINDSGLYGCHARNAFSSHSSTVQITVEGLYIPPTCTDNPFFANCRLIVRSKFCTHKYYSKFCCRSCMEAALISPQDLEALERSSRK